MHEDRATIPRRKLTLLRGLAAVATIAVVGSVQLASAGSPCSSRYKLMPNVVVDDDTKLIWQRGFGDKRTEAEAALYCENLTLDGADDFHLPSLFELQTIVDESRPSPVINTVFTLAPQNIFWTSTPKVAPSDCEGCVWYVDFDVTNEGLVDTSPPATPLYVRCVR